AGGRSRARQGREGGGRPGPRRGRGSGARVVSRCRGGRGRVVTPAGSVAPSCACGASWEPLLKPLVQRGRIARDLPPPRTIREHVLEQLVHVNLVTLAGHGERADF